MKLNNRGMTLIEMVVAFAILGIVSASIFSMMLTGTKTYTKLTNTVKLQYESQLATANVEKHIKNCNEGISWKNNSLVMIQDGTLHVVHWRSETKELYYGTATIADDGTASPVMFLLAEHVTNMTVDMKTGAKDGLEVVQQIQLKTELKRNGQTYTREKTFALRNLPPKTDFTLTMTF